MRITNDCFDEQEKVFLEFVLAQDFPERNCFLEQLNGMKPADLVRDVTPYYRILEFRPVPTRPGCDGMRPAAERRVGESVPTILTLYERDGRVFELEIYHADSAELDPEGLIREIIKERED